MIAYTIFSGAEVCQPLWYMLFEEATKQSGIISSCFMTGLFVCIHVEDLNFFDKYI